MVGGGASVTAEQLAAIFANSAELHVVVVLVVVAGGRAHAHLRNHPVLAVLLEVLEVVVLGLPLDALFFLGKENGELSIQITKRKSSPAVWQLEEHEQEVIELLLTGCCFSVPFTVH